MENDLESSKLLDCGFQIYESEIQPCITLQGAKNKELLRITLDGKVIAPDLESASEAGRIFVDSIREHLMYLKEKGNVI